MTTPRTLPAIRLDMTMAEIQAQFPSARRALFQRYHIGGCSSCAYQPTDTLGKVCKDHNLLDVDGVVQHLLRSHEVDQLMQVEPAQVMAWIEAGEPLEFIDIRPPVDAAAKPIAGSQPLDFANQGKYMQLPKDARMVFVCGDGGASLDAAAYFAGHGFTRVFAVRGGATAWRGEAPAPQP